MPNTEESLHFPAGHIVSQVTLPPALVRPGAQIKHCSIALCKFAAVPSSVKYVPASHSTHIDAAELDHFPAIQIKHLFIPLCAFAADPASVKYVPATQFVHTDDAGVLAHFPALQTTHFPMASCKCAAVPASAKYVPGTQSVQLEAAELDHVPALQIKHFSIPACIFATVPESFKNFPGTQSTQSVATDDHLPAEHTVQEALAALLDVPAEQFKHRSIESCKLEAVPGSIKYVPGTQFWHPDPREDHFPEPHIAQDAPPASMLLLDVPAGQFKHFSMES